MGVRPQKIPSPDSQNAQDVLVQAKKISKMSAKMPCKLISNTKRNMIKKTNASKLKQKNLVYILQPKADH